VQRGKTLRILEAEVIALRHQMKVLRRQVDRIEFSDIDQSVLAALARVLPRPHAQSALPVADHPPMRFPAPTVSKKQAK